MAQAQSARARARRNNRIRFWTIPEGFDFNLLFVLFALLGFGLLMIYSASSYVALRDWGDETHYFSSQLRAVILGLAALGVLVLIDYRFWQKFFWIEYSLAVGLVFLVLTPMAVESHNATRWVRIPVLGMNFQPAEASKLFIILFLAALINRLGKAINEWAGFAYALGSSVPVCLVIYLLTDNLSSAIIVFGIAFLMVFIASRDYKKYALSVLVVLVIAAAVVAYVANTEGAEDVNFRFRRIAAWLHPENSTDAAAHQALQGLYAIGSGGVWGKGLGQSVQKLSALPEPQNDMIFAIICEELGVVGAVALIILFVLLIWRMYLIARQTKDRYGFMIVVGVMSHISIQVVLNIAVATNSIPTTGVSLPFISYGGSSVLFLLAEIGLVLSVNRRNLLEEREGAGKGRNGKRA